MIKFEKQKGNFIKHCPCSPEAISCGYFNLNLHTGCPYSCSYCILQAYLETKEPIFILKYKNVLKNIVVSWSLNPKEIIEKEEHFSPDLNSRLKAIAEVQSKGYKIGIHFDPIILIKNWKIYYRDLIVEISKIISPKNIAWWSMGTLRFPYSLRNYIFGYKDSFLFSGELIRGYDGKYRYFKPLRIEAFKFIKQEIQSIISDKIPLYLCMEDVEAWGEIFPEIYCTESTINKYLYESVYK